MKLREIIKDPFREIGGIVKIGILLAGACMALGCDYNQRAYNSDPLFKELKHSELSKQIEQYDNSKRETLTATLNKRIAEYR